MRVSLDWLKEFVEINENPETLAELLSKAGLESEVSDVPLQIPGVIIGKVESIANHPDADKLKVCMVNDGKQIHQVVCGAPNVDSGQTIPFATVGSVLPGNFKIKKAKIRGIESNGMICSESELNISDEHDGIMVLPNNLGLGKNFMEEYGNKFISLELDITPNRPDAFSHQGVARDIACVTGRKFSPISVNPVESKNTLTIDVSMEDNKDCPRYIAGLIENVKVGPSPDWLIERLTSVGQRSINNVVDISNFVLMEIGHPTHIFDYDKLKNKKIFVRRSKNGESIVTLDEQKHILNDKNLLITDGDNPIALAGIMGGHSTAVNLSTQNLLVESAYFDPITIRKGSKHLSISTEASKRYERGADPNACDTAFWRVISLLEELSGGTLSSKIIDIYPNKITKIKVPLTKSQLKLVLGVSIDNNIVSKILRDLGIESIEDNEQWLCDIPTFRPDISREIDLIEEVSRIYGFDNIPSDYTLNGEYGFNKLDPEDYLIDVRHTLIAVGFNQIYSNSLQSERETMFDNKKPVKMMNPLNKDMGYLRTSLIPGLLKAADLNIKNSNKSFRIFELGNTHYSLPSSRNGVVEEKFLSGLAAGNILEENVHCDIQSEDIFSIKGYITTLFENKLSMKLEFQSIPNTSKFDYAHSIIINNRNIGQMGKFTKKIYSSLGLDPINIYGFELNLELIKKMMGKQKVFSKIIPYPKLIRDLNLVMPIKQDVNPIIKVMQKKGKKLVADIKPVNIFMDEVSIGNGFKSVTFSINFQHSSKTLEDKDVNPIIDEIINIAERDFNAKLRS